MNALSKKIRIKDIASLAGVSPGTVDRVIHNRGQVTEENRLKILKIIDELDYKPNLVARSLANKKNFLFASLCPEFQTVNDYWKAPDYGIERASREILNFNITVKRFYFDQNSVQSFKKKIKEIIDIKPDGVLLSPVFREETIEFVKQLDEKDVPYIFIDSNIEGLRNISYLGHNSFQSGYVAARLLDYIVPADAQIVIARIGVTEPSNQATHREEGIKHFLENVSGKKNFIQLDLDPENKKSREKFRNHIGKNVKGIIVINSKAFEVAKIVKESGLKDINMIGYDLLPENINYLKDGIISFLIAQRPEEQGYKGIMSLFNHLVIKTDIERENFLPIDILTAENIEYYLNYI